MTFCCHCLLLLLLSLLLLACFGCCSADGDGVNFVGAGGLQCAGAAVQAVGRVLQPARHLEAQRRTHLLHAGALAHCCRGALEVNPQHCSGNTSATMLTRQRALHRLCWWGACSAVSEPWPALATVAMACTTQLAAWHTVNLLLPAHGVHVRTHALVNTTPPPNAHTHTGEQVP